MRWRRLWRDSSGEGMGPGSSCAALRIAVYWAMRV